MPKKPSNGIYVPVSAAGSIANIEQMFDMATDAEIEAGMQWYFNAHNDAVLLSETVGLDLWPTCQVLSAISPQRLWENNVLDACYVIEAHRRPVEQRLAHLANAHVGAPAGRKVFDKAWRILDGDCDLVRKAAPKTYDFAMTIFDPWGYEEPPVDSHIGATWTDDYKFKAGKYHYAWSLYSRISDAYKDFAARLKIRAHQAAAAAWLARRRIVSHKKVK